MKCDAKCSLWSHVPWGPVFGILAFNNVVMAVMKFLQCSSHFQYFQAMAGSVCACMIQFQCRAVVVLVVLLVNVESVLQLQIDTFLRLCVNFCYY